MSTDNTGEAIMGILIAIPIFITGISSWWNPIFNNQYNYIGILLFSIILIMLYQSRLNNK